MGVKNIVIITTGQPSTNPRAVKEAIALADAGYKVTFVYNFWAEWALPFDEKIIKENPGITWQMAGGDPFANKKEYYFSRIRHKFFRILNKIFPSNFQFALQAVSRGAAALTKMASCVKADLYIAHNIGALPAAALAAKKHYSKYAFDAEDYHRGQVMNGSVEQKQTILLEDKYLPAASYLTAASPLIAEQYSELYKRSVMVINNVFSKKYLVETIKEPSKPVKLFWFSQTIGKNRGLEDIILALREMPVGFFSLTLLGRYDDTIKSYFIELGRKEGSDIEINFMNPVSPDEIFQIAAQHDIGLALEPGRDENNRVALSNKIFTYFLAGNAIIFSGTKAQKKFYEENRGVGAIYECGNIVALKKILAGYCENFSEIKALKINAQNAASKKYNWEIEKEALLKMIEKVWHE